MADPTGFRQHPRRPAPRRPAPLRVLDWHEVHDRMEEGAVRTQAARCMDCGVPFCHRACPLGNVIPEWNDLARRGRWRQAAERLHATNNFPEFTGRLCPAPCEAACVLAITDRPVTIEHIEEEIAERAFSGGWVTPAPPAPATGRRVAVVGSGPAGLAAAQQLARAGHQVVVYERADRPGGLLRYGIPAFKLEKWVLERRLDQLRAEGVRFETGVEVGPQLDPRALRASVDALVLATGAPRPRDLPVPGRALAGIHQAMEYLPLANRVQEGDLAASPISARGRQVVIIGGGDTGADCLGTAHRQGAASVHQLEIMPRPPDDPDASTPWPLWPLRLRTSAAHEEGGVRLFALRTERFLDDGAGRVAGLQLTTVEPAVVDGRTIMTPVPGPPTDLPAELVLLALGFAGPEPAGLVAQLQLELRPQGPVARQPDFAAAPGVFVCGDMGRGQSLVVWAIAEGRSCAAAVDRWLMGSTSLPAPIEPTAAPLA